MDHFHGVTAAGRHSKTFLKALRRDSTMLASSLPEGIVVHTYEVRGWLSLCHTRTHTHVPSRLSVPPPPLTSNCVSFSSFFVIFRSSPSLALFFSLSRFCSRRYLGHAVSSVFAGLGSLSCLQSRPDLFRVVIVGPEGTPFVHSLFFFDVSLPAEYPSAPPSVHFRCPVEERCVCRGLQCWPGTFSGNHLSVRCHG
jgi:hypothetical protein